MSRHAMRSAPLLALGAALLAALAGCGPRDKIGDRLIGQDSLTNGRSTLTNQKPQSAP